MDAAALGLSREGDGRVGSRGRLLAGREADLRVLLDVLHAAESGHGSAVVLTGDAGIGKSAVAERLAALAREDGWHVGWGAGWDATRRPPYGPWEQAVRGVISAAHVDDGPSTEAAAPGIGLAVTDSVTVEVARSQDYAVVVDRLRSLSQRQPVLVVLDDLHWFDPDSLALLEHVLPELRGMRVVLLGTARDAEAAPGGALGRLLGTLSRAGAVLELHGLSEPAVTEVVTMLAGRPSARETAAVVRRWTGGNPLFVREMVRLLVSQGRLAVLTDGSDAPALPDTVRAVLDQRLATISKAGRVVLAALAVLGDGAPIPLLVEVAECGEAEVRGALAEASGARLLGDEQLPAFAHDLVRESVRRATPDHELTGLHRRAAIAAPRWLGDGHRQAAAVAGHLAAAGEHRAAVPHRLLAADKAMSDNAWHEAAEQLHLARAGLAAPTPELLIRLGEALGGCGDEIAAREVFLEATSLARTDGDATAFARAALGYGAGLTGFEVSLFDARQQRLLEEALDLLPPGDTSLRSWVLARLSVALSFTADPTRRREMAEEAVAMARQVGDRAALARALASWCDAVAGPDDVERRLEASLEMERAARAAGDPIHVLLALRFRVVALLELGDVIRASQEVGAFAAEAADIPHPSVSWYVPLFKGTLALIAGKPEITHGTAAEVMEAGRRTGSVNANALGLTQLLGCLLSEGRYDDICALAAEKLAAPPNYEPSPSLRPLLAFLDVLAGREDAARAELRRACGEGFAGLPLHDSERLGSLCGYVEVATRLEDVAAADALFELLAPYRHRFVVDGIAAGFWGSVSLWAGRAAATAGRVDAAQDLLAQALREHRRIQAPTLIQATETVLAELLGRERRSAAGIPSATTESTAVFRCEGDGWRLEYAGRVVTMRDRKGLHDLAALLARPGQEMHVLQLASPAPDPSSPPRGTGERAAAGANVSQGDLGPVLDRRAAAEYRRRLADLEDDLGQAQADADLARVALLDLEREALRRELAAAFGLVGRPRSGTTEAERARKAVAARVHDALDRISTVHPELGRHLRTSVRTGTYCRYDPERELRWSM